MERKVKRGLKTLRQVDEFLGGIDVTPALGPVTKHAESLGDVVSRLSAHAVDQDASDRGFRAAARDAQQKARELRGEFLRPVAQLGRTLFPTDESLRQALVMPSAKDYEGLCAAGLAMAERAAEHKERFVAAGLGEDFVDRMKAAVEALQKELVVKATHFGRRSAATAGTLDEMTRGRELVKLLDIMLTPQLEKSPDKLAQWKTLSRFARTAPPEDEVPVVPVVPIVPAVPVVPPNGGVVGPTGDAPVVVEQKAA